MRDYAGEILQLHESKDAQGLARLAMELLAIAAVTIARRTRDAEKKSVRRHTVSPPTTTMSADTNGVRSSPISKENAIESIVRTAVCPQTASLLQKHCGEVWPDVEAFLLRREEAKEFGWAKEMLRLTTGTQYTVADLAQVCRDDAALDRAIGSPFALRRFLQNANHERSGALNGTTNGPAGGSDANPFIAAGKRLAAKEAQEQP